MAEKLSRHHEQEHHQNHEHQRIGAENETNNTHLHEHKEKLHQIRETAGREALSSNEVVGEHDDTARHNPRDAFVNNELKNLAYQRTMNRVRQNLSAPSRAFSRLIHQPLVDALSESLAKTIGRPSGILGGGILALIGTTTYYYITKHYGYDYNYFVFLGLLVGGFVLGGLAELVWRTLRRTK